MDRLTSLLGLVAMVGLAWLMSSHRRQIKWRIVIGGTALQFLLAVFVLRTDPGREFFALVGRLIEAAAIGATEGIMLAINVAAMLLAFLALIAMCNAGLAWLGGLLGYTWSLSLALAYLFAPLAWLMGIEWADCLKVGELLGLRMVTNEFVAYQQLSEWLKEGSTQLNPRSQIIATYALCGFANFASIGSKSGASARWSRNGAPIWPGWDFVPCSAVRWRAS